MDRWVIAIHDGECSMCGCANARWRTTTHDEAHADERLCDACLSTLAPEYR